MEPKIYHIITDIERLTIGELQEKVVKETDKEWNWANSASVAVELLRPFDKILREKERWRVEMREESHGHVIFFAYSKKLAVAICMAYLARERVSRMGNKKSASYDLHAVNID